MIMVLRKRHKRRKQRCVVLASRLLLVFVCTCVCVCGWVRMCANRSDRDAIVVSSLPAYPATLWQKRAKKRVNKNRFSFLTTHSHITYRIFSLSLSLPFSLCSLAIALTPPRYHFWFGSSLAYASTCLHYHCRLFFVVSVLSRSAQKQEVGIGSGRTSRSCALRRI